MHWIQRVLTIIGSMSLGVVLAFYATLFIFGLLTRNQEPMTTGFGLILVEFCGTPLGGLAGLGIGITWIRAHPGSKEWSGIVWLGIFLGLVAGTIGSWMFASYNPMRWLGTVFIATACGTVGGGVATLVQRNHKTIKRSS